MPYLAKHVNTKESKEVDLLYQCKWIVDETVRFRELTICENAEIRAPEGKMVTMIVNGVVLDMKPGKYIGDVVLYVSDEFETPVGGLMRMNKVVAVLNPAVCVEDGKVIPEKSVSPAVHYGTVTDTETDGAYIAASGSFNGVVVKDSRYTVKNTQMDLEGFGCNDYIGSDSAVAVYGKSDVTVENCEFNMAGVTRCAVHAGGDSRLLVKNCTIENVSPPSDWLGSFCWQLPFRGTNRLCQTADNAHVTYDNCLLKTNGWGIVSVDGVDEGLIVDFKDCRMEGTGPRAFTYGSFCIGPCTLNFDHTEIRTHGFPIICMCDEDEGFVNVTNGSKIIGRCFGFISIADGGSKVLFKDSEMDTKMANFVFRGSHTDLTLENMKISSANGRFIQMMDNIDTAMDVDVYYIPVGVEDVFDPGHDLFVYDPKEDIRMVIRDTDIVGDAFNSTTSIRAYRNSHHAGMGRFHDTLVGLIDIEKLMAEMAGAALPPEGAPDGMPPIGAPGMEPPPMPDMDANQGPKNLVLKLEKASVTGIISSAKQFYPEGLTTLGPENCHEVNNVTQVAAPTVNNGVLLELDGESKWIVTGTSYITKLTLADGAVIAAADGAVRMTVDGVETPIAAGEYTGRIVIEKN